MALNPQLTKSYAAGDIIKTHKLLFFSSKFSFYMLFILIFPILIEVDTLLLVWLGSVPLHTAWFVRLILLQSLFISLSNPLSISIQAVGNIKKIKTIEGICQISVLPLSYIILKFTDSPPELVFIICCIV